MKNIDDVFAAYHTIFKRNAFFLSPSHIHTQEQRYIRKSRVRMRM